MKTTFKVIKAGDTYRVKDNDQIVLQGFPSKDMALHGIWTLMGKNRNAFYSLDGDNVTVEIKDEL